MKRFLVFAGLDYYPQGGWLDCKAHCDTVEDAQDLVAEIQAMNPKWSSADWWHIVDTQLNQIIHQGDFSEGNALVLPWGNPPS